MSKNATKTKTKEKRISDLEGQRKKMQRLVWITVGCLVVALISLVVFSKPATAPQAQFAYEKLPMLGNPNAPVKIVEFGDFKCPTCQYFSQQIKPQLMHDYVEKGIVSFYFMNYTIIGPDSYTAALAAQSIYHQSNDAFWRFYKDIYDNQGDEKKQWATPEFLTELAKKAALPIDYNKLQQDIAAKTYQDEVNEQYNTAEQNGVNGTPTLFINGKKFEDVFNYDALKAAIEEAQKGGK